jgi:subtilisin family serine protease
MEIKPKVNAGVVSYAEGIYEVRITAPAGTEVFVMCGAAIFGRHKFARFRIADTMADGSALDPNVDVITPAFSATDTLGQHVITVASYNDTDGATGDPKHHHIADSSSRGPLRDFSNPASPLPRIATKPDLAAPGEKISSAESADTSSRPIVPTPAWLSGVRFVDKSGTSMAAPFVAGLVALMLDKKNDLNITEARTALTAGAATRPGVNPAPPSTAHTNAYGAGMVNGLESHRVTP